MRVGPHPSLLRTEANLPAWPVVLLVGGLPLWWVTGLLPFMPIITCLVFVTILIATPRVRMTAESLLLLAAVTWGATCTLMVDTPMRAVGSLIRLSMIIGALLVFIYVTNSRHELPRNRVLGLLFGFWLFVVAGGLLAVVWPTGGFTTPVASILPGGIRNNDLVTALVQPSFAEVQQPWGAPEPFYRPSAPFPYTNGWGAALAYLTPLAIAFRMTLRSTRRHLADVAILLSLIPAGLSSNRGMILVLAIEFAYIAIRMAMRGNARGLVALVVAGAVLTGAFVATGGLDQIEQRHEVSPSIEGRGTLYAETFHKTLNESPVMGFGAPRPAEGLDVPFGSQGAAWTYMFSYGFVGLALILLFLVVLIGRTGHRIPNDDLWLHASLLGVFVGMWFYGLDFMHLLIVALAGGLLVRRRMAGAEAGH